MTVPPFPACRGGSNKVGIPAQGRLTGRRKLVMTDRQQENYKLSYFFQGDFLPYREAFERHCPPPMKMDKGMRVCRSRETQDWMYYLCQGKMRVYSGNCEGNERTVAILGDDSIVGLDCLLPGQTSLMTIACVTDCWLMPFRNTLMEELIRSDADFALTLAQYYCKVLRQLCFDAANQSINSVFIRLANFLLTNWDGSGECRVRLSQQELAYAINCSRASISRACKILKEEKVITTEGIGFRILDLPKLERVCQQYQDIL